MEKISKSSFKNILIPFLLIIIPLVIFWQTTKFDFVWDDVDYHVVKNKYFQEINLENILKFWTHPAKMFMPVSFTFWAFLKIIGNNSFNPSIYHGANLILHIMNGILVFAVIRLFIKRKWAVLTGALFFLLHPIQVEAVAWVSELRGLLSFFFGFSALYVLLIIDKLSSNCRKKYTIYYILSILLFYLAAFSKPTAIMIPIFALIINRFIFKKSFKKSLLLITPWIVISAIIIIFVQMNYKIVNVSPVHYSLWLRPFIWMDSVNFYLYKIIFPDALAVSYMRTPQIVSNYKLLYFEWILPLLIFVLLTLYRKKHPLLLISFLIFIIGFLPLSGLVSFFFQDWSTVADRYIYLSMFGVVISISYILSKSRNKILWFSIILFLIILSIKTYYIQLPVWKNEISLWSNCIKVTPNEARAYYNRGIKYAEKKEYEKAYIDYSTSLKLDSLNTGAYCARGVLLGKVKQYDSALKDYNKALEIDPDSPDVYIVYIDIGNLYLDLKDSEKAIYYYNKYIEIDPSFYKSYYNRGNAYYYSQFYNEAIMDYNKAIELNPFHASSYHNKALCFFYLGLLDEAQKDIEQVKKLGGKVNPSFEKVLSQSQKNN